MFLYLIIHSISKSTMTLEMTQLNPQCSVAAHSHAFLGRIEVVAVASAAAVVELCATGTVPEPATEQGAATACLGRQRANFTASGDLLSYQCEDADEKHAKSDGLHVCCFRSLVYSEVFEDKLRVDGLSRCALR